MSENRSQSTAGLVIGLILIGLGILFLISQFVRGGIVDLLWPFFVIIPGLVLFAVMFAGGRKAAPMAIPASIVTMVGLILLYQNLFNYYESWAYAWALIPVAVGIGLIISGLYGGNRREVEGGRQTLITGIILFIAFGAFFELVIGLSGQFRGGPLVWSILLIGAGILVFITTIWRGRRFDARYIPPERPMTPGTDARYQPGETSVLGRGTVETPQSYVPPAPTPPSPTPPVTPPAEKVESTMPEHPIPVEPEPVSSFERRETAEERPARQAEEPRPAREEYWHVKEAPTLGRGVIEAPETTSAPQAAPPPSETPPIETPPVETSTTAYAPPVEPAVGPVVETAPAESPVVERPVVERVSKADGELHDTYTPVEEGAGNPPASEPAPPTEPISEAWQPVSGETPIAETTSLPTAEQPPEQEARKPKETEQGQPGNDIREGDKQ